MSHSDQWHVSRVHVKAFKSFGPSWRTFQVPSSHFVGVTGPNGCGKSNLLEAICFAAGGASSVLRVAGGSLQHITSTDAGSERPHVRLDICKGHAVHVVEATLTAEGSRSYKLDGKIKTGAQIKDFLKACGIVVDSSTVIQQAAITQLCDNNSPEALARLVASASGLASWNQETAAAQQEILRTKKALTDIDSNIKGIQGSAASTSAALQAATQAAQLEQQLEQQLEELCLGMKQREHQLQSHLEDSKASEQALKEVTASTAEQLQLVVSQGKAVADQAAEVSAALDRYAKEARHSKTLLRIASTEAELHSIKDALAARKQLEAEVDAKQQELRHQHTHCEILRERLTAAKQLARKHAVELETVHSSESATADLQGQIHLAKQMAHAAAVAVHQQQELLQEQSQAAEHSARQLERLKQSIAAVQGQHSARLATAAATSLLGTAETLKAARAEVDSIITAAATASGAASVQDQLVHDLQQQVLSLRLESQVAARPFASSATAGLLSQMRNDCPAKPLHECFRLKQSAFTEDCAKQQQLLAALSAIAGVIALHTLIVPSVDAANQILAAAASTKSSAQSRPSGKLRIWPLDNLSCTNLQQRQLAAQQELGHKAVILPLDILDFDPTFRPAMQRAFGGYLIAADDRTAAILMDRYNLSSVTLQGTVSRKGTMTGGWHGSSSTTSQKLWQQKYQLDSIRWQLSEREQQLVAAQVQYQHLQQQAVEADAQATAAQQLQMLLHELVGAQAEAESAAAAVLHEEQQLQHLQQRSALLHSRLQDHRHAHARGNGDHSTAADPTGGSGQSPACLAQQLQHDADQTAAAALEFEGQLEAASDKAEELAAQIETLECRLCATKASEELQGQLQQCLGNLQMLEKAKTNEEAERAQQQQQLQQLQHKREALNQDVVHLESQHRQQVHKQAEAEAAVSAAAAACCDLQQEYKQLMKDFKDTAAVHIASKGLLLSRPSAASNLQSSRAAYSSDAGGVPGKTLIKQLGKRVRQLQAQLLKLNVPELPPGQKEFLTSRLAEVEAFQQQAGALKQSAADLEAQMSYDAAEVLAANDMVFEDIAAGFNQLCSTLLPSLEVQLVRTASQAHEGLQFRFRRLAGDAAASEGPTSNWLSSLGQLSGGQRTLVSLAMLLAVARAGSACGLLLLDEIDAALDEVNQARASALLKQLACDKASACQILCVTHNQSFQEQCHGFVRITRSPSGHSVPEEEVSSGDAQDKAVGKKRCQAASRYPKQRRRVQGVAGMAAKGPARLTSRATGRGPKRVRFAIEH